MRDNGRKNYLVGHSKGANMGMVVTAKYPDLVLRADCLNPAGLCASSLKRFSQVTPETWSKVNVYHQLGDPVFSFEQGLPRGINLYGIIDPHFEKSIAQHGRVTFPDWHIFKPLQKLCNWFTDGIQKRMDVHLRYLVAHQGAKIIPLDVEAENHSRGREFRNDMKETMNKIFFVTKYLGLCLKILARKTIRALRITEVAAIVSKTFFVKAITKMLGIVKTVAFAGVLLPAILLTGIYSGLKILGKSLFTNCYRYNPLQTPSSSSMERKAEHPEPKKWRRTELPTNENFSKKLAEALQQRVTKPLVDSPFGIWAKDPTVIPLELLEEEKVNTNNRRMRA